jgi:hypothetical protein
MGFNQVGKVGEDVNYLPRNFAVSIFRSRHEMGSRGKDLYQTQGHADLDPFVGYFLGKGVNGPRLPGVSTNGQWLLQ